MTVETVLDWNDLNRKLDRMFPMPQIMAKILETLNDPNASAASLEKIFKHDPSFTLKILSLANSSYYGASSKISNIRAAITLLGLNMIKSIALHASVNDLFKADMAGPGFSGLELWKHSVGVGVCAKMISRRLHLGNAEDYFTLGILHDVGLLIEYQFFPGLFLKVLSRLQSAEGAPLVGLEQEIIGADHGVLSQRLCEKWRLPEHVCQVVRHHHQPRSAPESARQATVAVFLANHIVKRAGHGFTYPEREGIDEGLLGFLGLEPVDVEVIQEDFMLEIKELSAFFS